MRTIQIVLLVLKIALFAGRNRRGNSQDDLPLSTAVHNLQSLSHFCTAASVQTSLLNGSLSVSEFVTGMLRLGSVTLEEMETLKLQEVETAIEAFRGLPDAIDKSAGEKKVLEHYVMMDEVRKAVAAVDFMEWRSRDKFKQEIEKLAVSHGYRPAVKAFRDTLRNYLFDNDPDSRVGTYKHRVDELRTHLTGMMDFIKQWDNSSFGTIIAAREAILPLITLEEVVEKRESVRQSPVTPPDISTFEKNLRTASPVLNSSSDVLFSLRLLEQMANGSTASGGGLDELSALLDDINEQWMSQVLNLPLLPTSLFPLKQLMSTMKKAFRVFCFAEDYNSEHLLMVSDRMGVYASVGSGMADWLAASKAVENCFTTFDQAIVVTDIQNYVSKFVQLEKDLAEGEAQISDLQSDRNKEQFEAVLRRLVESDDEDEMRNIFLYSFKQSSDVELLKTTLRYKQENIDNLEMNAAKRSFFIDKINVFDNFKASPEGQKLAKLVSCLNGVDGGKSELAATTINLIKELQNGFYFGKTLEKTLQLVQNASAVPEEAASLRKLVSRFSSLSSNASQLISRLPPVSEVIGSASKGLSHMKRALDKRTLLAALVQHSDLIVQETAAATALEQTDVSTLNALAGMKGDVQKMLDGLDEFKKKITKPDVGLDEFYEQIIKPATSVPGVSGDFKAMGGSLDKLIATVSDGSKKKTLRAVKSAVAQLDGLNFASYQFEESKVALDRLNAYFSSLTKRRAPKEETIFNYVSYNSDWIFAGCLYAGAMTLMIVSCCVSYFKKN